jgi:hypothetical protein
LHAEGLCGDLFKVERVCYFPSVQRPIVRFSCSHLLTVDDVALVMSFLKQILGSQEAFDLAHWGKACC